MISKCNELIIPSLLYPSPPVAAFTAVTKPPIHPSRTKHVHTHCTVSLSLIHPADYRSHQQSIPTPTREDGYTTILTSPTRTPPIHHPIIRKSENPILICNSTKPSTVSTAVRTTNSILHIHINLHCHPGLSSSSHISKHLDLQDSRDTVEGGRGGRGSCGQLTQPHLRALLCVAQLSIHITRYGSTCMRWVLYINPIFPKRILTPGLGCRGLWIVDCEL